MNRYEYEIRTDQTRKVFDVLDEMIKGVGGGELSFINL